jgi:tRNA G26 N,N-dimethylase Trm1
MFVGHMQAGNGYISVPWTAAALLHEGCRRSVRTYARDFCTPNLQAGVKGISVLEALAASGLRAIRYAREVEGLGQVVANDLDAGAVQSMRRNIEFNGVGHTVTPSEADARLVMLQHTHVRTCAFMVCLFPQSSHAAILFSPLG